MLLFLWGPQKKKNYAKFYKNILIAWDISAFRSSIRIQFWNVKYLYRHTFKFISSCVTSSTIGYLREMTISKAILGKDFLNNGSMVFLIEKWTWTGKVTKFPNYCKKLEGSMKIGKETVFICLFFLLRFFSVFFMIEIYFFLHRMTRNIRTKNLKWSNELLFNILGGLSVEKKFFKSIQNWA